MAFLPALLLLAVREDLPAGLTAAGLLGFATWLTEFFTLVIDLVVVVIEAFELLLVVKPGCCACWVLLIFWNWSGALKKVESCTCGIRVPTHTAVVAVEVVLVLIDTVAAVGGITGAGTGTTIGEFGGKTSDDGLVNETECPDAEQR